MVEEDGGDIVLVVGTGVVIWEEEGQVDLVGSTGSRVGCCSERAGRRNEELDDEKVDLGCRRGKEMVGDVYVGSNVGGKQKQPGLRNGPSEGEGGGRG